jgi:uncharacterized protein (TIGR04255 family)
METTASGAGKSRIKFENPPINELVIALYHLPILELKAQYIGLYWDCIREKYPICEQQTPIISPLDPQPPQAFVEVPGEAFPLPRFWFYSQDHPHLIQIQRNAFILNWRRTPQAAPGNYPHFEAVVDDFWKELARYKSFVQETLGGKLDVVQRCELTYINLIGPNEGLTEPDHLGSVLPLTASVLSVQADDRKLSGLNATIVYRVNPTLVIELAVRFGKRSDNQELGAVLELKAHGTPSDLSLDAAHAWYEAAHDATYQMFLDSTSKQVQETVWKPR